MSLRKLTKENCMQYAMNASIQKWRSIGVIYVPLLKRDLASYRRESADLQAGVMVDPRINQHLRDNVANIVRLSKMRIQEIQADLDLLKNVQTMINSNDVQLMNGEYEEHYRRLFRAMRVKLGQALNMGSSAFLMRQEE
jgi:hypothetical protein